MSTETQTPVILPEDEGRIHDPAEAEVMAHAGKEHRERAVGLANMALSATMDNRHYISKDKDGDFVPHITDEPDDFTSRMQEISVEDALRIAKEHNSKADLEEHGAGAQYTATKERVDAIKSGKA